jgi:hypothetical protein
MRIKVFAALTATLWARLTFAASPQEVVSSVNGGGQSVVLASRSVTAAIAVDPKDYPVVTLSANLLADDVNRVSGHRPVVTGKPDAKQMVIAGTLGHSTLIDTLASSGKLKDLDSIKGRWEATLSQIVDTPFPGVARALVIVGSDRRGTAYGLMRLSENIGVSPWYWWADVPAQHRDELRVKLSSPQVDMPGVKYRGIFINDEDWGLSPWAKNTFDPDFKNVGPKTYARVFELMLRLRLNYIWPAMHGISVEFGSVPENVALADKYAIVAGSSHCEPMLFNNVHWDEKTKGNWDYASNKTAVHSIWEETVKARATEEAVWTIGIRGIHDRAMEGPPDIPTRIGTVTEVIKDQRALLNENVTREWGPVAQVFVPYKEVLPIYDAGLQVPPDVTLAWVDDNFGYLRRLSSPEERKRPGGAGVYWHISYYGGPHSYTWINTTPPALMWEELHKAWENEARTLWVINVGDIKPGEVGIDYFSRLAWDPEGIGPDSQRHFLREFAAENFGEKSAQPMADLLMEFYRLGTIREPELMNRAWALSLTEQDAAELEHAYENLLKREDAIPTAIPAASRDAYTETVGFPARILGAAGLVFMADRKVQKGINTEANEREIARWRDYMTAQVDNYNTRLAGGKWSGMMPGLVTGANLMLWSSQVRWPWGEKPTQPSQPGSHLEASNQPPAGQKWRDAAAGDRQSRAGTAAWRIVDGLGTSGRAMALLPAGLQSAWTNGDANAPYLEFDFETKDGTADAFLDFLPTFRIYPGMKLRVAVSLDGQTPTLVEVPGSGGAEDERGALRARAVQDNYVRARVPLPGLAAGKHTFKISAVDPGIVVDRVSLP